MKCEESWEYGYVSSDGSVVFVCDSKAEMAQYIYDRSGIDRAATVETRVRSQTERTVELDPETAQGFLKRYRQHYPLLINPDDELLKRVKKVRVMANGNEFAAKEVWETFYRGQIEELMRTGSDNYVAALSLMIPCMDRVYTLIHPDCDRDEVARPDTSYGWKVF